tara:strand:- start:585 stop:941 length:357 start_codon:yes stop_codon:yes gene_type:complete
MKKAVLILIATTVLSSCGEPKIESKLFYKDNDQARKDTLTWCAERPDQLTNNGNCVNAQAALAEKIQELKQARIAERDKLWPRNWQGILNNSKEENAKTNAEIETFNEETNSMIEALQ